LSNFRQPSGITKVDDVDLFGDGTVPPTVYSELSSGVVLCIDDNQDVLECERDFLEDAIWKINTALELP
jgi:hypothetical protein